MDLIQSECGFDELRTGNGHEGSSFVGNRGIPFMKRLKRPSVISAVRRVDAHLSDVSVNPKLEKQERGQQHVVELGQKTRNHSTKGSVVDVPLMFAH